MCSKVEGGTAGCVVVFAAFFIQVQICTYTLKIFNTYNSQKQGRSTSGLLSSSLIDAQDCGWPYQTSGVNR